MEFAFSEEQLMIRDTAEAFLAEVSASEAVRAAMATDKGYQDDIWQRICGEMYWQAIHLPEDVGGMGLGYVELVAMLEQMGRYLLCSPFFSTVCLGANALLVAGNESQQAEYLPQLVEGKTATLAYAGANSGNTLWGVDTVQASCKQNGSTYSLNGEYHYVTDGHTADLLIVAARAEGSAGADGISLFVLPADTRGVSTEWTATLDQTRKQARVQLSNVELSAEQLLGGAEQGGANLQRILDLATVALAAEQMGGAQQVLDITVEYCKERVQFNRPVASFQAVKHTAADMMQRSEVARSAVYYAACVADEALKGGELAAELPEAASIAKAYCSDAYFRNAGDAIQLHGGVGFTWEYDVHLFFKRAKASEHMLGTATQHRERVASMLLDEQVGGAV